MFSSNLFGEATYARIATNLIVSVSLILSLTTPAWGQSYQTVPTSTVPFFVEVPAVTLNQGDSVEVIFKLGTADDPVEQVLGFELGIELSHTAVFPATPLTSIQSSWLNANGHLVEDHSADPSNKTISLEAMLNQGAGLTGDGEIIRLTLICNEDGISATDLIAQSDGGLIMVENVEMKWGADLALDQKAPVWKAFPNPCQETLWISLEEDQRGTARLLTLSGQQVAQVEMTMAGRRELNTASLQPGIYFLQLSLEDGSQETRKITVR